MSYHRSVEEMLRLVDGMRPIVDQLRQAQRYAEQARPSSEMIRELENASRIVALERVAAESALPRTAELAHNFRSIHELIPDRRLVLAASQALESAVLPLPDFSNLYVQQRAYAEHATQYFQALNGAISAATFVAEVELEEREEKDLQSPSDAGEEEVEQQLIELASPSSLDNLRRVDFAPITLLNRALKDPQAMHSFSSRQFEDFVAQLADGLGFEDVAVTPRSGDEGRDVLAAKRVHGIPILFAFECKRFAPTRAVGVSFARALLGVVTHGDTRANVGVLVTTSRFTRGARRFILTEPSLDSRDFEGVVDWLREYADSQKKPR